MFNSSFEGVKEQSDSALFKQLQNLPYAPPPIQEGQIEEQKAEEDEEEEADKIKSSEHEKLETTADGGEVMHSITEGGKEEEHEEKEGERYMQATVSNEERLENFKKVTRNISQKEFDTLSVAELRIMHEAIQQLWS